MPDDTAQPLLDAIEHAEKSLRIKMFLFSDPRMLDAVIAAHRRGVKAQIMLNPERRNGKKENGAARKLFNDTQVEVVDSIRTSILPMKNRWWLTTGLRSSSP